MCGIFGVRASHGRSATFMRLAELSNKYRGPDGSNSHQRKVNGDIIHFGHTRLIITGDTRNGVQPVENENHVLVYNGEIFNFDDVHVGGISDTELLSQLLQDGISEQKLNSLNGFFAFAIYYPKLDSIYLVRDRFGEKPLYYKCVDGELFFSSTAKPFIALGIGNVSPIKEVKGGGIMFDENNPVEGVKQLPPGHMLCFKDGQCTLRRWYRPKPHKNYSKKDFTKVVDLYNEILLDAVRIRMKDQDSVAVSLSGGLDSTLVVDTVKMIGGVNIEAYTLSTRDPRFDELEMVRHHANKIGVKLNVVQEPVHDISQFLRCFEVLEFPSYNLSFVGYDSYYEAVKNSGTRVIIEGHGPDEYLGGYATMFLGYMGGMLLRGKFDSFARALASCSKTFGITKGRAILSTLLAISRAISEGKLPTGGRLNRRFFDSLSLPLVLRTFDRMSMLNNIETRSPFMDYRLVELGHSLSDDLLFHNEKSKSVLRSVLETRGFNDSDFGPKIGFTASYDELLSDLCSLQGVNIPDINDIRRSTHKSSFKIAHAMSQSHFSREAKNEQP